MPSLVLGLGFVASTVAAMTGTDRTNAGLGSGLLATNQQIGRVIGLAILVSVSTATFGDQVSRGASHAAAFADGLGTGCS